MALTAAAIKNAKGKAKPYKLTDSDGLFLYVTPNGGRYWRMNYRHMGKQKTLAFGVYPDTGLADTGLADAREQRDAARKVLAKGDDPAEKIRLDRIAALRGRRNQLRIGRVNRLGADHVALGERRNRPFVLQRSAIAGKRERINQNRVRHKPGMILSAPSLCQNKPAY